mmetsp:Transcript_22035/g.66118  ORF Transcript_22035/g.66118 Transcript_22035/m.66118 type:complete len:317 (-) Transcript_22035:1430-2380(-)
MTRSIWTFARRRRADSLITASTSENVRRRRPAPSARSMSASVKATVAAAVIMVSTLSFMMFTRQRLIAIAIFVSRAQIVVRVESGPQPRPAWCVGRLLRVRRLGRRREAARKRQSWPSCGTLQRSSAPPSRCASKRLPQSDSSARARSFQPEDSALRSGGPERAPALSESVSHLRQRYAACACLALSPGAPSGATDSGQRGDARARSIRSTRARRRPRRRHAFRARRPRRVLPLRQALPGAVRVHVRAQESFRCGGPRAARDADGHGQDRLPPRAHHGVPVRAPGDGQADLLHAHRTGNGEVPRGAQEIDGLRQGA